MSRWAGTECDLDAAKCLEAVLDAKGLTRLPDNLGEERSWITHV
jgi:hypothetical protein